MSNKPDRVVAESTELERLSQAAMEGIVAEAQKRLAREVRSFDYARWTFYAAVAAVAVGIAGVIVGIASIVVTLKH